VISALPVGFNQLYIWIIAEKNQHEAEIHQTANFFPDPFKSSLWIDLADCWGLV